MPVIFQASNFETIYPNLKDFSSLKQNFIPPLFCKLPFDNHLGLTETVRRYFSGLKSVSGKEKTCKKIKNSLEKTFVQCYVI